MPDSPALPLWIIAACAVLWTARAAFDGALAWLSRFTMFDGARYPLRRLYLALHAARFGRRP